MTQSAVSHAIKALEEDLACRLVDRVGKRIRLTASGEQFLAHAESILREMHAARSAIQGGPGGEAGVLRLGAGTTACQYLLPGVIAEFRSGFPRCSVALEPGDQARQLELLRGGHVDLAFLIEPAAENLDDLILAPLFEDELRLIVSPRHPWARLAGGPGEALATGTLILTGRKGHTLRLVTEYFRQERTEPGTVIALDSIEAAKETAKLELGAAILPPWVVSQELASGALVSVPLGRRRLRRQWSIAYWKGRHLTPVLQAFVGLCETASKGLGSREMAAAG